MKTLLVLLISLLVVLPASALSVTAQDGYIFWMKGDGRWTTDIVVTMPYIKVAGNFTESFNLSGCLPTPPVSVSNGGTTYAEGIENAQCGSGGAIKLTRGIAELQTVLKFKDTVTDDYNHFYVPFITEWFEKDGDILKAEGFLNTATDKTFLVLYNPSPVIATMTIKYWDGKNVYVGGHTVSVSQGLNHYALTPNAPYGRIEIMEGVGIGPAPDLTIVGFLAVGPESKGAPRIIKLRRLN
jgi:hypothetical protein